jgi:hypothetical protein
MSAHWGYSKDTRTHLVPDDLKLCCRIYARRFFMDGCGSKTRRARLAILNKYSRKLGSPRAGTPLLISGRYG